mgnify:CR=1 FL=1
MSDLISRQVALDIFDDYNVAVENGQIKAYSRERKRLCDLSLAQPEIIYCGDCKYKDDGLDEDGIPFLKCLHNRNYGDTRLNDFCSWAERREK